MTRIALIQMNAGPDPIANLAAIQPLVEEAIASGAQLIATPECSNFLRVRRSDSRATAVTQAEDAWVQYAQRLSSQESVWFLLGSVLLKDPSRGEKLVNRQLLFAPGGEHVASYDKIHMFDVEIGDGQRYAESETYAAGMTARLTETPLGTLGHAICYDLRFPHLFRLLSQAGAEILLLPAAFTAKTGAAHWESLLRARAIENSAYVLAPAQGGEHEGGRMTWGRSCLINPWGELVAQLDHDRPGLLLADLDLSEVQRARTQIPAWQSQVDFRLA